MNRRIHIRWFLHHQFLYLVFCQLVIIAYYLAPRVLKNIILLVFSLAFYAWGEVFYVLVMITSIVSNYFVGHLIFKYNDDPRSRQLWLTVGIYHQFGIAILFQICQLRHRQSYLHPFIFWRCNHRCSGSDGFHYFQLPGRSPYLQKR